jgi:hypothetical protein
MQNRLVQHCEDVVQLWPTDVHAEIWHVPVTAPAGTTQLVPLQQSAFALHMPP